MLLIARNSRGLGLGSRLLRKGLERAGGVRLDVRTRTEGYHERLGASRSLGFRLTREDLGSMTRTPDRPLSEPSITRPM